MKTINRNVLKYIAIAAMLSDHIAMLFMADYPPVYFAMRLIGRLTAAIMCFFIAEGFHYTRSRYKYGMRLGIFALISQFAYTFFESGTLFTYRLFTDWNVIFTLFIGFCVLLAYEKIINKPVKWIIIGLLCAVSFFGDWMIIAPLWILCFYVFRDNKKKRFVVFGVLAALEVASCVPFMISNGEIWQIGVFLVIPLLWLYNGGKGDNSPIHKWAFYLFYPLHLIALAIIHWALV
ncbi:MAG: conjugal transfer protein TraX [Oscillospiraceae bacterium]|nr:conjugal transfer protein TraX [Oscillospiraceae bacterium]